MNPSRRLASLASGACALALLCAAVSASAEEISREVEAEGSSTATDQPASPKPRKTGRLPRRVGKVDVSEAARRLEQAQLERQQGLEPQPGEFILVGGTPTPTYRYWKRQEKLRLAVELAQRRSQATLVKSGQLKVSQI